MPIEEIDPVRKEEEDDEDEDDIVLGDGDDEDDEFDGNPLADLLVTEDGDNIADGIVKAIDRVGRLVDTQNKILVKFYTVLSKIADNNKA